MQTKASKPLSFWHEIAAHISLSRDEDQVILDVYPISGGDISEAFCLECSERRYFIKINKASKIDIFNCEIDALKQLGELAPKPICSGQAYGYAFLALEYLDLRPPTNHIALGQCIAALHSKRSPLTNGVYGWPRNNYIGLSEQTNALSTNWCDFWLQQRLSPQLVAADQNGFSKPLSPYITAIKDKTQTILEHHRPVPNLLHGDLWSGNTGVTREQRAVIFDPAIYVGDSETDLAMTRLFGGFSTEFYRAYHQVHGKQPGQEQRQPLYNLYHLLNHLNIFGEAYLQQVITTMRKIIDH